MWSFQTKMSLWRHTCELLWHMLYVKFMFPSCLVFHPMASPEFFLCPILLIAQWWHRVFKRLNYSHIKLGRMAPSHLIYPRFPLGFTWGLLMERDEYRLVIKWQSHCSYLFIASSSLYFSGFFFYRQSNLMTPSKWTSLTCHKWKRNRKRKNE